MWGALGAGVGRVLGSLLGGMQPTGVRPVHQAQLCL